MTCCRPRQCDIGGRLPPLDADLEPNGDTNDEHSEAENIQRRKEISESELEIVTFNNQQSPSGLSKNT